MDHSIIIVLANFMDKSGKLNKESCSRLDLAIDNFSMNKNSFIITSGWNYYGEYDVAIAESMRSYILKNSNILNELILSDDNARDTVGDAIFTKINIVKKIGHHNLLIVTSDYHIERAHNIFSYVYGEQYKVKVIGSKTIKNKETLEQERRSLNEFHKTFKSINSGNDFLMLKQLCNHHPYYNGDIYPKIQVIEKNLNI
jgi:vancomycin permeability regulator SanA